MFSEISPEKPVATNPATATEIQDWLTTAIAKELEVDSGDIDNTASIMSFGLESLTLFTLTGDLANRLGCEISTTLFWDYQTIEAVATYLGQEQTDTPVTARNSNIVEIQPNGAKTPLFLIHPAGGHVWCYSTLAKYMGEERPIYGFLISDRTELHAINSLEELASLYVRRLREFYPQGPYILGGLSMGGVIAFEMAQQLRAQGEEPALLVLFDSRCPGTKPNHSLHRKLRIHLRNLRQLNYHDQKNYVFGRLKTKAKLHLQESRLAPQFMNQNSNNEAIARTIKEIKGRLLSITDSYVPKEYDAPITLLRAKINFSSLGDRMGWDSVVHGKITQYFTPGTHTSIIGEPNAREFAARLNRCLDEIQESKE
jgi:thioesterase domain-containing protein/acyl carrier protein